MGAGKLYGLGILTTAILTLLTPLIANIGLAPLVAIRILEGIFEVLQSIEAKFRRIKITS